MVILLGKQTDLTTSANTFNAEVAHPLDPLRVDEISKAASIVKSKAGLGDHLLFETIVLREPPKKDVLAYKQGTEISREAFIVVLNYSQFTIGLGIVLRV